jgi:hypothetical protein
MFLWLRFLNVPAGTYTVDVTPTIQPNGSPCTTSTPFRYQSAQAAVTQWALTPMNYQCHPLSISEVHGGTHSDKLPVSFTINAIKAVLVQVHLDYCALVNGVYTVTGSLMQGTTVIQSCTHQITIKHP